MSDQEIQPCADSRANIEKELWEVVSAALLALGRSASELCPPIGAGVQDTLLRLRRRLAFQPTHKSLVDARHTLDILMRDYGRHAKQHLDRRVIEANELLVIGKQSADLLEARDRAYIQQIRTFGDRSRKASQSQDLESMRESILNLSESLALCADSYFEDSNISISDLRNQIQQFEKRRQLAEETTVMDPSTGLIRRAEMERRIRRAYYAQVQFSVMKFVLHDFSDTAREHGTDGFELLMRHFAQRLADYARPQDPIARWDQRSLMILASNCSLDVAEERVRQMSGATSGEYKLTVKDQAAAAEVQITAVATEPNPDEYLDDFISRADLLSPAVFAPQY